MSLTQFRIQQSWQITKWIRSRNISIFIFDILIPVLKTWQIAKWICSRNISIFIYAILIPVLKTWQIAKWIRSKNISTFIFAIDTVSTTKLANYKMDTFKEGIHFHFCHFNTRSKTWQIAKWILSRKISIFIFAIDKLSYTTKLANYKMDTIKEGIHFHICHFNTHSKTWQIAKWILSRKISIFIFAIDTVSYTTKLANCKMDTFKEGIHFHICRFNTRSKTWQIAKWILSRNISIFIFAIEALQS